jgi:uncharacterized protein YndB with AHSA1/START domain
MQTATGNELTITRVFDAPRDLVWKAWTEPELFKKWWGPKDYTAPYCTIDLRVGGRYLSSMRGPDGKEIFSTGVYHEIVPQARLVMTDSFSDEDGNVVPSTHYGMSPDFPLELQVTVTFEDLKGSTMLTMRHEGVPGGEMRKLTAAGWEQSFDKLAALLSKSETVLRAR